METLKLLWLKFSNDHTKGERIWILSSVLAAFSAVILLFFIPTLTIVQAIIVVLFSTISIAVFWFSFTSATYVQCDIIGIGWLILTTAILWMFPISVYWSLIPLGIIFFVLANWYNTKTDWISPIGMVGIFAFLFVGIQNYIDAKNYLKTNPEPEVVVLSNFDSNQEVFFIEGQEQYLKFKGFGAWNNAFELGLKKGDTVKIVRHPNNEHHVIKISK